MSVNQYLSHRIKSLFSTLISLFFEAILLLSLTYVIGTMLTNQFLRYLKERAIRKGVWFKVLDRRGFRVVTLSELLASGP